MTTMRLSPQRATLGRAVGRPARATGRASEEQQTAGLRGGARPVRRSGPATACSTSAAAPGVFLRLCADRGATRRPASTPSESLLDGRPRRACRRPTCASATCRRCPYADDTFDLVTGFTSFFFADDMVAALREAGRVARPGARRS